MYRKISQIQRKILDIMYITVWTNKRRSISNEEYLYDNQIPFIYVSASQLAISGYIATINGYYEQYIISVYDVLNKIKLKTKLKIACFKRNRRIYNNNIMIILHQWNKLPKVINKYIINFLNYNIYNGN